MAQSARDSAARRADADVCAATTATPFARWRFASGRALGVLIGSIVAAGVAGTTPVRAQLVPGITPITIGPPRVNPETIGGPVGVLDRTPLELYPIGIQAAPGLIFPTVTGTMVYDDNIFAAQFTPATDLLFHLRPEITLRSPEGMFTYTAQTYADLVKFTQHPDLSNGNLGFSLGMKQDFARDWQIESQTAAKYDHQDPSGFALPVPNSTVGSLPVYTILQENLILRYRTGRFRLITTSGYEREDFANTIVGTTPIKESTLDANALQLEQRVDYYVSHLTQVFVDDTLLRREYDNRVLNSTTVTALVGAVFEYDRLIRGTASIGWRERVYDLRTIGSIGSPTFAFNLAWYPTEMLTVTALGSEEFADSPITTGNGSSAIIDIQTLQAEADYEFTPQWVGTASAGYATYDYSSTGRADTVTTLGASLLYRMNRNMAWTAQYKLSNRNSNQPGFGYQRQQIGLALKVQY
jgi:hypothetical protein